MVVGDYYCRRFNKVRVLPTCACFWKRSFLNTNQEIRFPVSVQPAEDGLFSHRLILLTEKISFNPGGVYFYRSHPNQNHKLAGESQWKILKQIPSWLNLLEEFYLKNNLLENYAIELALFLEHEPFEFRYLDMNLDLEQKEFLFKEILGLYKKIEPYIPQSELTKLSHPFLKFVSSTDVNEFDQWYNDYISKKQRWNKILLKLSKLIPISNLRRKVRGKISEKY